MRLTGTELLDWIGLRRVHEGGVAMHGSGHVDWGRKVPCYLPEVFDRLAEAELTSLLDVDCGELRRVVLTPCGNNRYQELTVRGSSSVCAEQGCSVPPDRPSSRLRPVRGLPEGAIR